MQAVIELGRVVRDRKTMPLKYPLPELVLIHKDQQCLDDVKALEKYVLEELNIKTLTLSTDKKEYGVTLRAEPDHKTLGLRLKGAFKDVMREIKALNDQQVTEFIDKNEIEVLGHKLGDGDLRIMYSFDATNKELAEKYEAHSDNDVLILLDCTPDQSMLDEGVKREVQIRIQKLRKKAKLVPSDPVTVYYEVKPSTHDLVRVIEDHKADMEATTKSPVKKMADFSESVLGDETYDLKGAKLRLVLVEGIGGDQGKKPSCKFVNICTPNGFGTVLLENPKGQNIVKSPEQLKNIIEDLFGITEAEIFADSKGETKIDKEIPASGKTVFAKSKSGSLMGTKAGKNGEICHR